MPVWQEEVKGSASISGLHVVLFLFCFSSQTTRGRPDLKGLEVHKLDMEYMIVVQFSLGGKSSSSVR